MKYNIQIPGWMEETDLKVLSILAENVAENGNILEVGSFLGRSTSAFAYSKHPSVNLTVVDTFNINEKYSISTPRFYERTHMNGDKKLFLDSLEIISGHDNFLEAFKHCLGNEISNQIDIKHMQHKNYIPDKKFDLVFIDGDHSTVEVSHDIRKHINDEILIVGDDFHFKYLGVLGALASIRLFYKRTLIIPENSNLWIMVPPKGRWNELFRKHNFCFFD